jgi:ADP-heptose:LPS heptosyltransferase
VNCILIIKPSSLGDIIHGLMVAQSIRDQMPDCRITWVVRERFAALVRSCPTVDSVIVFERRGGPRSWLRLARELQRDEYEYALDFQGLARSALMMLLARARLKIGRSDAREGAGWTCHKRAPLPPAGAGAHAVEILLQFLPLLGLEPKLGSAIRLGSEALAPPLEGLPARRPLLMAPHSRAPLKEWRGFPEVTRLLRRQQPETPVVWCSHKACPSPEALASDASFFNLTGRTSLGQMIGLIQSARALVVNDSGPLHIAAAVGTPLVACFGPTVPARFGPYPPNQATHRVLRAPDGDLSRLPVAAVYEAVTELLARPPSAA